MKITSAVITAITVAFLLTLALVVGLSGCANPEYDKMQARAVQMANTTSVTCKMDADCRVKWARVQEWVSSNAVFRIKFANDYLVQTMGPIHDGWHSGDSAITVNLIPQNDGSARIQFRSVCASSPCVPSAEMLYVHFANAVNR